MNASGPYGAAESIVLGRTITMDPQCSVVEGVAIRDGRIIHAGTRNELQSLRAPETAMYEFGDRTVIPGFNDTHAHTSALGLTLLRPSLEGCRSIAEVQQRIREIAQSAKKGEWIVTMPLGAPPYYWDAPEQLAERRMPNHAELAAAAPDNPVYIPAPLGYWGQPPGYAALSTLALELNGLDRTSTCTLEGVELQRDANGDLTGVIVEHGLYSVIEWGLLPAVPRFTAEQRLEGLRRALPMFHEKGTTSVYDGHGCAPELIASYRTLWENDELTLRSGVVVSPTWLSTSDIEHTMRTWLPFARGKGLGDERLRISGIFVAYGGPCHLNQLISKDTSDLGWLDFIPRVHSPQEFEEICMLAGKYDLRIHTIASDKLHELVPILERVAAHYPIGKRRWAVEHISRARPADLEALRRLGVAVTLIPIHYLWKAGNAFAGLSEGELDLLSPAAALTDLGVPVAAGTDAIPNDPLFCMWCMVTRQYRDGQRTMGKNGAVSNETALRLLTSAGAWLTFDEHHKGRLQKGHLADLAILSGDPLCANPEDLLGIHCEATMVGGRWVYGEHA